MLKATFLFNLQRATPSESHYAVSVSTFAALAPYAAQLATLRAQCLGYGASIIAIRLSDTNNPRDVEFVDPTTWNGQNPYPPQTTVPNEEAIPSDQPNSCVLLNITTTSVPKKMYMSLCPDDIIGTEFVGGSNLTAQFNPAWFASFLQFAGGPAPTVKTLCGGRWGCLVKSPTNKQAASAIVAPAPYAANSAVVAAAPLAAAVGGKVLVKGFRSINPRLPSLSGVYKVLAVLAGNTYVLAGTTAGNAQNVQSLPGNVSDMAYSVAAYTSAILQRGTTRRRGGSVFLPRGRSRTRR